jgi:hypothetical protein
MSVDEPCQFRCVLVGLLAMLALQRQFQNVRSVVPAYGHLRSHRDGLCPVAKAASAPCAKGFQFGRKPKLTTR